MTPKRTDGFGLCADHDWPNTVRQLGRGLRVAVTGSRDWADRATIEKAILHDVGVDNIAALLEGGARGADALAYETAEDHNIPIETFKAEWGRWGAAAGPLRNKRMLLTGKPDLVLAFHKNASPGTQDMIDRTRKAGICLIIYQPEET